MEDSDVREIFGPLFDDPSPANAFNVKKPLLAHYTTIQVLERILETNEIWFSNPLFMNDLEEVRFGILEGNKLVLQSDEIAKACKTKERASYFWHSFNHYFGQFDMQHIFDTYVFCMSEHETYDNDGLLSMWRGYGANGNGVGIVFDTGQLSVVESSPLIMAAVAYETTEARMAWLKQLISRFVRILDTANIPDEKFHLAAYWLFERIKLFALFTKHHGFKEEREWRIVYLPDRDVHKKLHEMFSYAIGPRGIEPKLRFKILPVEGVTAADLSLTKIMERIIMGPSISSPMALAMARRMFDRHGHLDLKPKLRPSTIPFRPLA